jgi:hypothetical protein
MKRKRVLLTVLLLVATVWLIDKGYCIYHQLVTLDVRNMPMRDVMRTLERQTWTTIYVHKDLKTKLTIKVHRMSLEKVLGLICAQANRAEWNLIYPIYSSPAIADTIRQWFCGEIIGDAPGWTNFTSSPSVIAGIYVRGMRPPPSRPPTITLQLTSADPVFAATAITATTLALQRHAQVIPEDSATEKVQLKLRACELRRAVAAFAHQLKRNWTHFYVLTPSSFREATWASQSAKHAEGKELAAKLIEAGKEVQKQEQEARLQHMPKAEREAWQKLTPEQRRAKEVEEFTRQATSTKEGHHYDGLINSTPEQRVEQRRFTLSHQPTNQ